MEKNRKHGEFMKTYIDAFIKKFEGEFFLTYDASQRRLVVSSLMGKAFEVLSVRFPEEGSIKPYVISMKAIPFRGGIRMEKALFQLIDQIEEERNAPFTFLFSDLDAIQRYGYTNAFDIQEQDSWKGVVAFPSAHFTKKKVYVNVRNHEETNELKKAIRGMTRLFGEFRKKYPTSQFKRFSDFGSPSLGFVSLYHEGAKRRLRFTHQTGRLRFQDPDHPDFIEGGTVSELRQSMTRYLEELARVQGARNLITPPRHHFDRLTLSYPTKEREQLYGLLVSRHGEDEVETACASIQSLTWEECLYFKNITLSRMMDAYIIHHQDQVLIEPTFEDACTTIQHIVADQLERDMNRMAVRFSPKSKEVDA